jgi:uncharacterized membrane protein
LTYALTFREVISKFLTYSPRDVNEFRWIFGILSLILAVTLIVNFVSPAKRKSLLSKCFDWELLFLGLLLVLISAFIFISGKSLAGWAILFNVALFVEVIGIIFVGYYNKNTPLVYIGLGFFVLDFITRYFDYCWEFLDRALFFIIGGILLIVIGRFLEKARSKIIKSIKGETL